MNISEQQNTLIKVIEVLPDYLMFNVNDIETALNLWTSSDDLYQSYIKLNYNNTESITSNIVTLKKVIDIVSDYLDDNINGIEGALSLWSVDLLQDYENLIRVDH
jgi:hypothetical protein